MVKGPGCSGLNLYVSSVSQKFCQYFLFQKDYIFLSPQPFSLALLSFLVY